MKNLEKQKRDLLLSLAEEISDKRVLEAIGATPREMFVPPELKDVAYIDVALPIAEGQSISQPTIVAMTMEAMDLRPLDKVLEVGAGSGYQAALLGRMAREVVTVERVPELALAAERLLAELGCSNVRVVRANDELGWRQGAPYDSITVAAAAPRVPQSLIEQLAPGGRLIVPIGDLRMQTLVKATRTEKGFDVSTLTQCRYVPLISGDGGWSEEEAAER